MGFKVAIRVFDYAYSGTDAIYDQVLCYTNFFGSTSKNLSDCYVSEHMAGEPCSSNTTLGLVCSDGTCKVLMYNYV